MNIFLLGATGQTGHILLKRLLESGHDVTAYVRSKEKIRDKNSHLTVIQGDIFDQVKLSAAMTDHDAVISCLGGDANNESSIITDMTKAYVSAMKYNHIERLACISTAGIHNEFSFVTNLIVKLFYKHAIEDHKHAAEYIMKEDLNYTIARPLSLVDGELTTRYRTRENGVPKGGKNISRHDLAHFLVKSVEEKTYSHSTVGLAY